MHSEGNDVMDTLRMGRNGTVVIPAELRQRFGLDEGVSVVAEASGDGVLVKPAAGADTIEDRRRRLLEETNRAYAALRADPDAWREELAERAIWDVTNLDGLDEDEWWTDEGERGGTPDDPSEGTSPRRDLAG